jgi:PAS domain S-box-containing protein
MQPRHHEPSLIPHTLMDLDALAAFTVECKGGGPIQVAEGIAELLLKTLGLDFVYLRLKSDEAHGNVLEVARTIHQPTTKAQTRAIGDALTPWLDDAGTEVVRTVTTLRGKGPVRVVIVPLGCDREVGVLAAGSMQADFPSGDDRLRLNHVARQAATVLQYRRAEEARGHLQRERDELLVRLRLQFERMPISCIVCDRLFRIIDWNPAAERIFGYRREEAMGKNVELLLVPPASREYTGEINRRLVAGDMIAHGTYENITKDGRIILCEWHNTPLRDADGEVVAIMAMAQDVTERARTEEKLTQSQSLLAEAEHLCHVGSWSWEIANDRVFWSDEHYRIYGLRPQEMPMTYDRVFSCIHPDDRAAVQDKVDQAFRGLEPYECCLRTLSPDGTTRVVHARAQVVCDEAGNLTRMFGTSQDITEQRRNEEAIEQSHRRFQAVFENSLDGILLMDDTGRLVDVNPSICQLLGYNREELLTLTIRDVTTAQDRDRIPDLMGQLLYTGTQSGEYALLCKDGTTRVTEYRAVANMLPGLHLAVHRDLTKRKRAEEETRILNAALENAVEGIARLDTQERYLTVNRAYADMLGHRPEELVGRDWQSTVHVKDLERVKAAYERRLSQGRMEAELRGVRKDGSTFWKQIMMVKAHDQQGQWIGHYCFMKDITRRKRAEEALRDSAERLQVLSRRVVEVQEQERRHIARELHDEIGQVLSAISVNLHTVKAVCDTAARSRIDESINIIDHATEQVRDLSLNLRPSMLDDLGLAATLRWLVVGQAERAGLVPYFNVQSSGAPLSPNVAIAGFRVVQEALNNVVRHARAKHIWVDMRQSDHEVDLAVRDDGVGFDPETTRRRAARGESFGLLGIQERVELLGGRANIRSQAGRGTRIRVWLPLRSPPSAHDSGEGTPR